MSDINNIYEGLDNIEQEPKKQIDKKPTKQKEIKIPKVLTKSINKTNDDKGSPDERQSYIMSIQNYGNNPRLGKYLKKQGHNFKDSYLKKLSLDDLKLELSKQELALSNKNNTGLLDIGIKNGLNVGEKIISNKTKYNINGLTNELYINDHYLDLLERVKLKYCNISLSVDPILELSLVVAQTAIIVNAKNNCNTQKSNIDLDQEITINDDF